MAKMTRALERGLVVLECLESADAASLAELARATALPKATLLRLLSTLIGRGWVYRRVNDGQYVLSATIGGQRRENVAWANYTRMVVPILRHLTRATGLAADLTAVKGAGLLEVIESTRKRGETTVDPWVAGYRPSLVFSSPGRAILAASEPDLRDRYIAMVMRSDSPAEQFHVSSGALAREIRATAARGYAQRQAGYWPSSSDFGDEPMDIAVPVHLGGRPRASISLVWPARQFEPKTIAAKHLSELNDAAAQASELEVNPERE